MKMYMWFSVVMTTSAVYAQTTIRPITQEQIPAAKETIISAWNEVLGTDRTVEGWEKHGHFDDLNDVDHKFISFFVLLDEGTVVGTAGIKPLNNGICELKRMWLLKPYRGKGWGGKLLDSLVADAITQGFKRMYLEVWMPQRQQQALNFYQKHGFSEIPAYRESREGALFMEKILER